MFKAVICYTTESLWLNPESGNYEGCDPDTFEDHGVIDKIESTTLDQVKEELHRRYGLKDAEVYDNVLTISFDGEHHHDTPINERIPFIETYLVYLSEVVETVLDCNCLLTKKVS